MANNTFETAVKAYLDGLANEDPLFAETYLKPNKSISECCRFIRQEARKQAENNCAVLTSDDVFDMAVHYYDEDDIKVEAKVAPAQVVATKPAKPEPKKTQYVQLSLFDF